jgi:hypothetical protein
MSFSRVGTGRGPIARKRGGPPGGKLPEDSAAAAAGSRTDGSASHSGTDGPVTTVYTQAIGAADALRRKQRKALKVLRDDELLELDDLELEKLTMRNNRQVGLGLRSGAWLPTNAIAETSSSIDNQPRERASKKRGGRQRKRRSPSTSPSAPLDPIATQVAASGMLATLEAHLAANASREQEYADQRERAEEALENLEARSETDQAAAVTEMTRLQSLLSGTQVVGTEQQEPEQANAAASDSDTAASAGQPEVVPYRQQASKRVNTDAAREARQQLSHDPLVKVAIDRIWILVTGYGRTTQLDRRSFITFNILVQKALDLESSFNVFQADRAAAAEWEADTASADTLGSSAAGEEERDAPGGQWMTHTQFHDSLFELVDIWTSDISAQAYAAFLWQLLQRISRVSIVFDDSVLDHLRTRLKFKHNRQGAAEWDKVRKDHHGQVCIHRHTHTHRLTHIIIVLHT